MPSTIRRPAGSVLRPGSCRAVQGTRSQYGGDTMMNCMAGQSSLGQMRASFFALARPSRFVIRGVPQRVQRP
jgi:hypothetical protein